MKSKIKGGSRRRLHVALILLLLLAFTGFATPFRGLLNPGPPCSLADQIIAANDDKSSGDCPAGDGIDTIRLNDSVVLRRALPAITSEIVIESGGHTIDGGGKHRIFEVRGGVLHINDLTIIDGEGAKSGAILLSGGAELVFERSVITDSSAVLDAAIASEQSKVSLIESDFFDNSASGNGSAIHHTGSELSISGSSFENNSAAKGGAIGGMDTWLTINDSELHSNFAEETGGGLPVLNGSLLMKGSEILSNSAVEGGGIYSEDARLSISESYISENQADRGGGVYYTGGVFTLKGSIFSANCAYEWGASLYSDSVALDERNNTFEDSKYGFCDD